MRLFLSFVFVLVMFAMSTIAQPGTPAKPGSGDKATAVADTPLDTAKAALAAHGGDKLKKMRSLITKGAADLNVMGQLMPGAFSTAISGEKYYFEINAQIQSMKQIYDGRDTYSSVPGFSLPPITSLGFPLLPHVGDAGYVISANGNGKKKGKGFRVTTPDGFYTDFFVDDKTGQIKAYESSYNVGERVITTSVEIDEFQTVDGIVVPKKYSQRIDLGQMTAYAVFKTKDILINSTIDDSAFAIPK